MDFPFQVRRDVRLLLSAKPEEILSSAFEVIRGRNPSQRIFLLERYRTPFLNFLCLRIVVPFCKGRMRNYALIERFFGNFMSFLGSDYDLL